MRNVYVFDIDGVLANHNHRKHYIDETPKDWEAYYGGMLDDGRVNFTCDLVTEFKAEGHFVVLATGRPEKYRDDTCEWMKKVGIYDDVDLMLMRPDGDFRPNPEVKEDHARHIQERIGNIIQVLEDDPRSVEVWKRYSQAVLWVSEVSDRGCKIQTAKAMKVLQ